MGGPERMSVKCPWADHRACPGAGVGRHDELLPDSARSNRGLNLRDEDRTAAGSSSSRQGRMMRPRELRVVIGARARPDLRAPARKPFGGNGRVSVPGTRF